MKSFQHTNSHESTLMSVCVLINTASNEIYFILILVFETRIKICHVSGHHDYN